MTYRSAQCRALYAVTSRLVSNVVKSCILVGFRAEVLNESDSHEAGSNGCQAVGKIFRPDPLRPLIQGYDK